MRMLLGSLLQLAIQFGPSTLGYLPVLRPRLDKDNGLLRTMRSHTHQRRAIHPRMLIENRFARNREQHPASRNDAMRLATAEPKPVVLQITDVAHPVPKRFAVADFMKRVGVSARDIIGGDHRAPDN